MVRYVAKRIRFRNGECHSVLQAPYGLLLHEVTVYLEKFRKKGRPLCTVFRSYLLLVPNIMAQECLPYS